MSSAQHLHDYRVNRSRGQEVRRIDHWCIHCRKDAAPRWLYCSDTCAEISRSENSRRMWKK